MVLDKRQEEFVYQLYKEMYCGLMIYAKSLLPVGAQAEEAVEKTFVAACMEIDDFMSSTNPKAWLLRKLMSIIRKAYKGADRINKLIEAAIYRSMDTSID